MNSGEVIAFSSSLLQVVAAASERLELLHSGDLETLGAKSDSEFYLIEIFEYPARSTRDHEHSTDPRQHLNNLAYRSLLFPPAKPISHE
jgi:hypothetical protein